MAKLNRENIAMCILTTSTYEDAAEKSGVSKSTLYRLRKDPEFQDIINQVKNSMFQDTMNTNIDNSSNDTTTTDKSDHSSIKTDNSVTNTNSGNTTNTTSDNSQRTEDNSSVTYNYYYPSAGDSEGQSQQPQQIVIHNYIQGNNEDQGVSSSQEEKVLYDPMKNVSIDAEGVDVVFEVVDGVYSISIKAREPEQQVQQAAEEPATESFMVDWYEVIKIALLGAIVFVVKKK